MSLSTLMTKFSVTDGQQTPFRLAILTETGSNQRLTTAILKTLCSVSQSVHDLVELKIYCIGLDPSTAYDAHIQGVNPKGTHPGARWNEALRGIRNTGADAVFLLEKDSIVDANTLLTYRAFMQSYFRCLASFDQYFIDADGEKIVFWNGHTGERQGTTTLTGRCLHREWLDQVEWTVWTEDATCLEVGMQETMDRLKSYAAHSGEHRIFGCIAHNMAMMSVRDNTDGFFDEAGDSAQTSSRERDDFFKRFYPTVESTVFCVGPSAGQTGRPSTEQDVPGQSTTAAQKGTRLADESMTTTPKRSLSEAVSKIARRLNADPEPGCKVEGSTPVIEPVGEPNTQSATEWIRHGESAFAAGQLDVAKKCFESALLLEPLNGTALNNLAVSLHTAGDLQGAEKYYLQAVAFDPECADPFVGLVSLAMEAQQIGLALRYIARGLKRDPGHPQLIESGETLAQNFGQNRDAQEVHP